jgi:hypothetical protein
VPHRRASRHRPMPLSSGLAEAGLRRLSHWNDAANLQSASRPGAPRRPAEASSPVMVLTPEFGEAATASKPDFCNFVTTFEPISPVPPITMIFTMPSRDWMVETVIR